MSHTDETTRALAQALGVTNCRKAVLTLEVGKLPRIDAVFFAYPGHGCIGVSPDAVAEVARAPFKVRLYLEPMEK